MGAGALAVLASLLVSIHGATPNVHEIVGRLMLLGVLGAAVHLGRRGGLIAAVVASAIYTLMSIPELAVLTSPTSVAFLMLVARLCAYGLVGIIGGEACGRIRFEMARAGHAEEFDEWSQVFNQRHASSSLTAALAAHERYLEPFAVALVTIGSESMSGLRPQHNRTVVRFISARIRENVRATDEVARLADGRFFILLRRTSCKAAEPVALRLTADVQRLLGTGRGLVTSVCYDTDENATALAALAAELSADEDADGEPDAAQVASGVYSSLGESVLNPAAASAVSAPGASTLKMSTAAAPDGSTKQ